jgi:AAA family ATP:ADP antiporter
MTGDDAERRTGWVATIAAVIVVAGFVAGKAARDAILLSNFRIETLPIFIAISALLSLPIILVAGKLMARFGPARLMPALNLISAAFAVVEWLLLARYPRPTSVAIYVHLSTSGAVLVSGFWSIINEQFDVQSAKRHVGRIGMGATLGGIAGGLIAERVAVHLAPDAILLVLAGLQLACAATLRGFREPGARLPGVPRFALKVVTRSRLLRNLGVVVVFGAVAAGILDYVFKADIVATASRGGLLRSLAIYYTVTSVLTAIVQVAICGPLIARLGVPRTVATLPLVVTAFGLVALAVPAAFTAMIARGAETIARSSIYRAGYELLYAPLSEADKRPAKIVLDVGAERIGDLVGAQLVGLIVYLMIDPRIGLLIATVATGAIAMAFAIRLPRSYTLALQDSLLAGDPDSEDAVKPFATWPIGEPVLGQAGELSPLPLRILEHHRRRRPPAAVTAAQRERVSRVIAELRSQDPVRIKRALATELTPEIAALVIGLVARDDVGREALAALCTIAPRCTGMVVDALLDPVHEVIIRRRLPEVLFAGEPALAAWGLWRGLVDPSFEVRYHCGAVLSRLAGSGKLAPVASEAVFEAVRRELITDPGAWHQQRITEDPLVASAQVGAEPDEARPAYSGSALEHVFTVLGLVLPPEPLRIALHAVQTDDSALRETALEYLESILPADVRGQLWPLLESESMTVRVVGSSPDPVTPGRNARSRDDLVAELKLAYPTLRAGVLDKRSPRP